MTIPELNTLGGYGETGTANLTTNYTLNSMFHTTLDGFLLSGMDETKAISLAKQQVASAFFNYDGVAIPNYYDKAKSDELLANKADLVSGKVPTNQLPEMDYVPNSGVGNEANKIPKYNADGHLVFPSGGQLWVD